MYKHRFTTIYIERCLCFPCPKRHLVREIQNMLQKCWRDVRSGFPKPKSMEPTSLSKCCGMKRPLLGIFHKDLQGLHVFGFFHFRKNNSNYEILTNVTFQIPIQNCDFHVPTSPALGTGRHRCTL